MGTERRIYRYNQAGSTNLLAKKLVGDGGASPGTVIVTSVQTGGQGQYGRTFSSPQGGLYFSLLLSPSLNVEHLPLITLATGVTCVEILETVSGLSVLLKWPNDLILGKRKLAGILCETVMRDGTEPWVIVGVGINVNSTAVDFPRQLEPLVTTLFDATGRYHSLDQLLDELVRGIERRVKLLGNDYKSVLADWSDHDYLSGRPVRYLCGKELITGEGVGLAEDGRYIIRDHSGKLHNILGGQLRPDV